MTRRTKSGIIAGPSGILRTTALTDPDLIDSWEDKDVSEYQEDTGQVIFNTSTTASDGSVAAEIKAEKHEILSPSGNGLNKYPKQGKVWRVAHNFPSGAIPRTYFGVQSTNPADNNYRVELDEPDGAIRLVKRDGGTDTVLDSTTGVTFDLNAYTETEVEWRTNGRMLVKHFDSNDSQLGSTLDATDTTFTSGGFGVGEWSSDVLSDGLVQWWPIDEESGSTVYDDADSYGDSTKENLAINGASWNTGTTEGTALNFDQTNDYCTANDPLAQSGSFTWAVEYVTPNDLSPQMGLLSNQSADNGAAIRLDGTGNVEWVVKDDTGGSTTVETAVTTGEWYRTVGRYDDANGSVYIKTDGNDNSSNTDSTSISGHNQATQTFWMGADASYGNYFGGKIARARRYNKALSDSQIDDLIQDLDEARDQ